LQKLATRFGLASLGTLSGSSKSEEDTLEFASWTTTPDPRQA